MIEEVLVRQANLDPEIKPGNVMTEMTCTLHRELWRVAVCINWEYYIITDHFMVLGDLSGSSKIIIIL